MHRMVIRNKGEFLKKQLIEDFREAVSSSKIFAERDDLVHKYNLTCTVVDRIDSSIDILNNYSNALPTKEEEVVLFMVYACMLKDGIYALYEKVFQKKPPCIDNKKYFINVSNGLNNIYTVETCPTDDVFFEYYRALVFAHPFDTRGRVEKRCFIKENEIQLSPWVIPYKSLIFCVGISDPIGIRIYSNKNEKGLTDIYFSFENLKKYIQERYDYLINKPLNEITREEKTEYLKKDDFGRCVFKNDMDIVDRQSVVVNFANGSTATLNMVGGASKAGRHMHIVCEYGEIEGYLESGIIVLRKFNKEATKKKYIEDKYMYEDTVIDINKEIQRENTATSGHSGGDYGIMHDLVRYLNGEASISTTEISDSVNSHLICYAAETSRIEKRIVNLHEFNA